MIEQPRHFLDRVADELGRDPHRLLDLFQPLEAELRLSELGRDLVDLQRDPLGGVGPGRSKCAPEIGVLLAELAHAGLCTLEIGLALLAPEPDVLVDDLDHLTDCLGRDEVPADEVHYALVKLVGANVRAPAAGGAAVVPIRAGVGARHPGAAGAAQELGQDVAAGVALRRQAMLAAPAKELLNPVP